MRSLIEYYLNQFGGWRDNTADRTLTVELDLIPNTMDGPMNPTRNDPQVQSRE